MTSNSPGFRASALLKSVSSRYSRGHGRPCAPPLMPLFNANITRDTRVRSSPCISKSGGHKPERRSRCARVHTAIYKCITDMCTVYATTSLAAPCRLQVPLGDRVCGCGRAASWQRGLAPTGTMDVAPACGMPVDCSLQTCTSVPLTAPIHNLANCA
ncbi:hypothetical protein PSPO01_14628 [Paraphaeosphaeria sporulosa]